MAYNPNNPLDTTGGVDESPEDARAWIDSLKTPGTAPAPAPVQSQPANPYAAQQEDAFSGLNAGLQDNTATSGSISISMPTESPQEAAAKVARTDEALGAAKQKGRAAIAKVEQSGAGAQKAIDDYRKNQEAVIAAREAEETKQLADAQTKFDQADDVYNQAVKARTEYRAKVQADLENMNNWSAKLAAEQPRDAWAESPTWNKVTSIALMGLGAAAQTYFGDKTNVVVDQIDAALKRDLMMQRLRLDKGKETFANKGLLLRQFIDTSDHMQQAEDKAYVTAIGGITARLTASKNLLTSPTMRANLEKNIAELQMKAALKQQDVSADIVGKDLKLAGDEAHIQAEREKAGKAVNGLSISRAQTAAGNLKIKQQQEGRKQNALVQQGWEGTFTGTEGEAKDLRETETDTAKATQSMDQVVGMLEKGGEFSSYPKWQDIKAAANRAVVKLKGKGLVNAGANFTEMENELIRAGYLSSSGDWLRALDPSAANRIRQAEADLWDDVKIAMEKRGLKPSKTHPVFGGE